MYRLLKYYAKKWLVILLCTSLGLAAGLVYNNYLQVPLYKSNATLLLINSDSQKVSQDATLINNYVELLKSRRVLEPVLARQSSHIPYDELVSSIEAKNEKSTEVIKLAISAKSPETSKSLVEGTVDSFKKQIKELYGDDNVLVVDDANLAAEPYNVYKELQLVLFTLIAATATVIILFFVYDFKGGRVKTAKIRTRKKRKPFKLSQLAFVMKAKSIFARRPKPVKKVAPAPVVPAKTKPKAVSKKKITSGTKPLKATTTKAKKKPVKKTK